MNMQDKINNYHNDLRGLIISDQPTLYSMNEYQRRLDILRTEIVFEYAQKKGELQVYEQILKTQKEILHLEAKALLIEEGKETKAKPPTSDDIKSKATTMLRDTQFGESGKTLFDIMNSLRGVVTGYEGLVEIVRAKQDSTHTPNNLAKFDAELIRRS